MSLICRNCVVFLIQVWRLWKFFVNGEYSKYCIKMSDTSIQVKIYKTNKCIYENNNNVVLNANNLNSLISCLKNTQIEINDFLTSLIKNQNSSDNRESK